MLIRQDRFRLPPRLRLHNYVLGNEVSMLLLEFPNGHVYACSYDHSTDVIVKIRLQSWREVDFSLGIDLPMFRDTDTPYWVDDEADLFPKVKMPSHGVKPFKLR